MLAEFALLIEGSPFSIGCLNLLLIYVSFRKHIAPQKWRMNGKNSGKAKRSFPIFPVLILVKDQLDFRLQSLNVDSQGRYILLEVLIQDSPFVLLNIYAPNKCAEQCDFLNKISEELKSSLTFADSSFVIGGDFNMIFYHDLDGSGGIKKTKESVKILEDICLEQDLIQEHPTTLFGKYLFGRRFEV